jgi:hypothetical protein
MEEDTHTKILSEIATALSSAMNAQDLGLLTFLTRRLAAEVTEDDWSHHQKFIRVKAMLCDSGDFERRMPEPDEFVSVLMNCLADDQPRVFGVRVPIAPVPIPKVVTRSFKKSRAVLSKAEGADAQDVLSGVETEVTAASNGDAAAKGLDVARFTLDRLRLTHYVRTHLQGPVVVRDLTTDAVTYLALPQPFWSKAPGRREVPAQPAYFHQAVRRLPDGAASNWRSAQWHLSQALADWAEDSHTAAAHIWQALESFAPGGFGSVAALAPEYLRGVVPKMAQHIATRISLQVHELRTIGYECDWYYWVSKRVSLEQWMNRVLRPGSSNCYVQWASPPAPAVVFSPRIGLLQITHRRLRNELNELWMERRIAADFALLYGLRNKAVHRGQRVFSRRMARYLGQLGLEVLLGVMGDRAQVLCGTTKETRGSTNEDTP